MPEPSRDAYLFAGFLVSVMVVVSYLHLGDAPAVITFCTGAASFILGYKFGLPVIPEKPVVP